MRPSTARALLVTSPRRRHLQVAELLAAVDGEGDRGARLRHGAPGRGQRGVDPRSVKELERDEDRRHHDCQRDDRKGDPPPSPRAQSLHQPTSRGRAEPYHRHRRRPTRRGAPQLAPRFIAGGADPFTDCSWTGPRSLIPVADIPRRDDRRAHRPYSWRRRCSRPASPASRPAGSGRTTQWRWRGPGPGPGEGVGGPRPLAADRHLAARRRLRGPGGRRPLDFTGCPGSHRPTARSRTGCS